MRTFGWSISCATFSNHRPIPPRRICHLAASGLRWRALCASLCSWLFALRSSPISFRRIGHTLLLRQLRRRQCLRLCPARMRQRLCAGHPGLFVPRFHRRLVVSIRLLRRVFVIVVAFSDRGLCSGLCDRGSAEIGVAITKLTRMNAITNLCFISASTFLFSISVPAQRSMRNRIRRKLAASQACHVRLPHAHTQDRRADHPLLGQDNPHH